MGLGTTVYGSEDPRLTGIDPELGILRLQPLTPPDAILDDLTPTPDDLDPELGVLRVIETEPLLDLGELEDLEPDRELGLEGDPEDAIADSPVLDDPELGTLRLRDRPIVPPPPRPPAVFAIVDLQYFRSNNILLEDRNPTGDGILRPSFGLYGQTPLAVNTQLIGAAEVGTSRYGTQSDLNYHDLRFQVGVRHDLSRQWSVLFDWTNRQLFDTATGDRFLNDHSPRLLATWRQSLASDLTLTAAYQARWSIATPQDRSRVIQSVGVSLSQALQPDLALGLDYRFTAVDYTHRDRLDAYHQLVAELTYDLSRRSRFILYGGYSLGDSSDRRVNFDGTIFGIGIDMFVPLF
jgi:hypothetical protein